MNNDIRRDRYTKLMERAVTRALVNPSAENEALAESAIKTYGAALDYDYKTLWQETDWMLLRAQYEIQHLKEQMRVEKERSKSLEWEVKRIEQFHGISR